MTDGMIPIHAPPAPSTGPRAEGRKVLVCAPFGRDAQSIQSLLRGEALDVLICADLAAVAHALDGDTGAVLLTEEALPRDSAPLRTALARQPEWSDVPFVLLAASRAGRMRGAEAARIRFAGLATNSVVLDRPLGAASLLSAVRSAIRLRRKQFEMRDRLQELARRNAELARSQDALQDSEAKFQAITDSIDQMVWSTRPDGHHDYYNRRWYEYTGLRLGSTDGEGWKNVVHPGDQDGAWALWQHSLATGEAYEVEYRLRHRTGQYRWVLGRAKPMRDGTGRIVRWFGTCTEIQELVEAREVLARSRVELEHMVQVRTEALHQEMASREQAEAALRQSQKMEAVGQLTGGIAHDFNNMMTGVLGGLDMVRRRIAAGRLEGLDRFVDASAVSAQRAARLTARLLAFSRRQSLDPRPVAVDALAASLEELLRGTLGENIALEIVPGDAVPDAVVDANQLESAILNLAINARDAMPEGGALTIETALQRLNSGAAALLPDVPPGLYVVLSVSDTGVGMPPEVLERVFEPFFTTKPVGQGTGLGLSMVYGFARQSGGQVRIHSTPGFGTSVRLYLPAAVASVEPSPGPAPAEPGSGGGRTVLVVEDDASVRLLVLEVLREFGYVAIETTDALGAMPVLASARPLDLLVSDVGLPGMNGRQLAELARQHRPGLPVLFITGYAENAAIRAGFLGTGMSMVMKPFTLDALAAKIATMLPPTDGSRPAPP